MPEEGVFTDVRDVAVQRRLLRAEKAFGAAMQDMKAAVRRLERLQVRIARLRHALAVPAAERRARAARGVETRRLRAVPEHRRRGIRLSEEDG
jgi:hypothetical protein